MVDDIPLDKIVEPHRKEIFLDTTDENRGSPSNDCPNVRPGKSLSSSPVHHELMATGTKENDVNIENSKKLEIKEETDDITNSLFGKCGKCQKPRPGLSARPDSMNNIYDWLSHLLFFRKTVWLSTCLLPGVHGKTNSELS